MRIARVQTLALNLPMLVDPAATPMLGGRARTSIDMLLVRIDTDIGITGWGEAFGHRIFHATRAVSDTLMGPMIVGRDATRIAALTDDLQRALHGVGATDRRPTRCRVSRRARWRTRSRASPRSAASPRCGA